MLPLLKTGSRFQGGCVRSQFWSVMRCQGFFQVVVAFLCVRFWCASVCKSLCSWKFIHIRRYIICLSGPYSSGCYLISLYCCIQMTISIIEAFWSTRSKMNSSEGQSWNRLGNYVFWNAKNWLASDKLIYMHELKIEAQFLDCKKYWILQEESLLPMSEPIAPSPSCFDYSRKVWSNFRQFLIYLLHLTTSGWSRLGDKARFALFYHITDTSHAPTSFWLLTVDQKKNRDPSFPVLSHHFV